MSTTVSDHDENPRAKVFLTSHELDDVFEAALKERHHLTKKFDWHFYKDGHPSYEPDDVTVIAIVIDVAKKLVRKMKPLAFCECGIAADPIYRVFATRALASDWHPTELQAWLAAYNAIKEF